MSKFGILASVTAIVASLGIATLTSSTAVAGDDKPTPCVHKELKTELIKQACAKGGQPEAKAAMKAFNKQKNIKSCNKCHSKLAPSYDLKADGLDQFKKLGGK
ncbi:MAG: hypothetical protein ABI467_32765 [Kofleriaceae bacterium]